MLKPLVALAALAVAGSAQAGVVTLFADDFQGETPRLSENVALANWTVGGDVDIVGMPNPFGITCSGTCVDLDGTTGPGALTSSAIAFAANGTVRIEWDLSGSQRSSASDNFSFILTFAAPTSLNGYSYNLPGLGVATFGPISGVTTGSDTALIAGNAPWTSYFFEFDPVASGSFTISFGTTSADNIGPLLDNVLVTQGVIPEPASWAMLIAGFGLVGTAMRRRRTAVAA